MSGVSGGNDREFMENLNQFCQLVFSQPSERTVNDTLIKNIESAVSAHLITRATSDRLQAPLQPLGDRQISTLTTDEQESIQQAVQQVLRDLSTPADEGFGSAASAADEDAASPVRTSQTALLQRKKRCQQVLKKRLSQNQFEPLQVKKNLFSSNQFTMKSDILLETLTPLPEDLSLQESMPNSFRDDHVKDQRGSDTQILFLGRDFPTRPMAITKKQPENAETVQILAKQLAGIIAPSQDGS